MPRIEDLTPAEKVTVVEVSVNGIRGGDKVFDFFADREGKAYWREQGKLGDPLPCGHSIELVQNFLARRKPHEGGLITLGGLLGREWNVTIHQDGTVEAHRRSK